MPFLAEVVVICIFAVIAMNNYLTYRESIARMKYGVEGDGREVRDE